jgi:hypothetical protein
MKPEISDDAIRRLEKVMDVALSQSMIATSKEGATKKYYGQIDV